MKLFFTLFFSLYAVSVYTQQYGDMTYNNNSKLYVVNINAVIENNMVVISWNGVKFNGLKYYVYKHTEPIANIFTLSKATLVSMVDSTYFPTDYYWVKDVPSKNSYYYYAVACVLDNSQILFTGSPGVDMMASAISFSGTSGATPTNGNSMLSINYAKQSSGNNVLYWQDFINYGEYLVYRSTYPINSQIDLSKAKLVGKTKNSFFIDAMTTDDDVYYYVIPDDKRNKDVYFRSTIEVPERYIPDNSFKPESLPPIVRSFNTLPDASRVIVNWKIPQNSSSKYSFILITSMSPFKNDMNVFDNQGILDILSIDTPAVFLIGQDVKYIFTPRKKEYINTFMYYALVAVDKTTSIADYKVYEGMYTKYPVKISALQPITDSSMNLGKGFILPDQGATLYSPYNQKTANGGYENPPIKNNNTSTQNTIPYGYEKAPEREFEEYSENEIQEFPVEQNQEKEGGKPSELLNSIPEKLYLPPIDIFSANGDYKIYYNNPQMSENMANDGIFDNLEYKGLFITNSSGDVLYLAPNNFDANGDDINGNDIIKSLPTDIADVFNVAEINKKLKKTYDIYDTYNKARALYIDRNYKECARLLEGVYFYDKDINAYCKINILLGRAYYKTGSKNKSIAAFNRVTKYKREEASFWIKQVIMDL